MSVLTQLMFEAFYSRSFVYCPRVNYTEEEGNLIECKLPYLEQRLQKRRTLEELLQAGYKILTDSATLEGSIEDRYGDEFRRLGLSTEGAFEFSDMSDLRKVVFKWSENNIRRLFIADTSMANLYKASCMQMLQKQYQGDLHVLCGSANFIRGAGIFINGNRESKFDIRYFSTNSSEWSVPRMVRVVSMASHA
ncbi:unnamed protein product [Orchesella dallaii]|uniref:Uncharacterized protein n=1 Tax=Orchesella dallaii TaxID=48710 RepID=A0ABP1RNR5_9HEXA